MDYVTNCAEPSLLPVGAYLLTVDRLVGDDWVPTLESYQVEADTNQQAAERAAAWCCADGDHYRGTVDLITGDDSSRQIATIDGDDWRLC